MNGIRGGVPGGATPAVALGAVALGLRLAALGPLGELVSGGSIPAMDLMSDPAEVTGAPWYVGGVSDLTLFVWAGAATLSLTGAVGMRRTEPALARALAALGALTLVVLTDDRFLLHEVVLPNLGVPQIASYLAYAVALVALLAAVGRVLVAQPEVPALAVAVLALGVSVLLDLTGWDSTARRLAEETAKTIGAVAWCAFPAAVLAHRLSPATGRPSFPE